MDYKEQIEKIAYTKRELAKKWGVPQDQITGKDLAYAEQEHNKKVMTGGAGIASAAVGKNIISKARHEGMLDGVVRRYHNTKASNVNSIKESGILASKAMDPDNLTSMAAGIKDKSEQAGKTYMSKKKSVADGIGMRRDQVDNLRFQANPFEAKKTQKTLKVNIPLKDYRAMPKTDNPELMGAKNAKEFQKVLQKKFDENPFALGRKVPMMFARSGFNQLGPQTDVIQGDIASKYIKGGKGYEKQTLKGVANFIKENPGHFAKGIGHVGAGAVPIALGGKLLMDSFKKTKNPHHKEASLIVDECFEKIAVDRDDDTQTRMWRDRVKPELGRGLKTFAISAPALCLAAAKGKAVPLPVMAGGQAVINGALRAHDLNKLNKEYFKENASGKEHAKAQLGNIVGNGAQVVNPMAFPVGAIASLGTTPESIIQKKRRMAE